MTAGIIGRNLQTDFALIIYMLHAKEAIMEIFEVTGFSDILTIV